jgi:hypothetical protein
MKKFVHDHTEEESENEEAPSEDKADNGGELGMTPLIVNPMRSRIHQHQGNASNESTTVTM